MPTAQSQIRAEKQVAKALEKLLGEHSEIVEQVSRTDGLVGVQRVNGISITTVLMHLALNTSSLAISAKRIADALEAGVKQDRKADAAREIEVARRRAEREDEQPRESF